MSMFTCPDVDFSGTVARIAAMSPEELEASYQEAERFPKYNLRKFVADVRAHPEHLTSWDMSITFEEFARQVEAGEYD